MKVCDMNKKKKVCPKGHKYDDENTYLNKGKRYCKECHRETAREHMRRKRASLS
jgi:hypothetical protein